MSRTKLAGSHNRCWIWGRHVVLETLRAQAWKPVEVLLSPRCPPDVAAEVRRLTGQSGQAVQEVTDAVLQRKCRSDEHQGLAASLPEFSYADLPTLLASTPRLERWLILDGIQDSFNFGAMLRCAVELQIEAVLVGTAGQSPVNSQVARSSAGAVNHLPIARVEKLVSGVEELKKHGVRIVAASEKADRLLHDVDLTGPTGIVIGNEGRGVSPDVWNLCDEHLQIPTAGRVGSLNAAVAAGILCYELSRQRALGNETCR